MSDALEFKDVPPGCMEIPGFILPVKDGAGWLRFDGIVTHNWEERGIWPTPEAARAALDSFFP